MASVRHNYNRAPTGGCEHARDNMAEKAAKIAAKIASRNLLVAQLRYGQHGLQETAFWDTVRELRSEGAL